MQTEFMILSNDATANTPCAIRLKAPEDVARIPVHLILMLDISESMMHDNKLENVKKCSELILTFLNDKDRISLITFGDTATLCLKALEATETNKKNAEDVISKLMCDGCTNLSAGLGYVGEAYSMSSLKTGLIILTDGHANRGVHNSNELRRMISSLRERHVNLSINCVAYGNDHNAELLRYIAEDVQGAYTIVKCVEDTAVAFGDTLGGLMSCAFQNVTIQVPKNTIVHGPYKITSNDTCCKIQIADIYAGTKPLILLDIPTESVRSPNSVQVTGNKLPELDTFTISLSPQEHLERQLDIELARHRYTCTKLLKDIQSWDTLSERDREGLAERITKFEEALQDEFLNGSPVTILLRNEIPTLRTLLEQVSRRRRDNELDASLSQHIAVMGLGRGFNTPIRRHAPVRPSLFNQFVGINEDSDNETQDPAAEEPLTSAFQNPVQATLSVLMRTASRQPRDFDRS